MILSIGGWWHEPNFSTLAEVDIQKIVVYKNEKKKMLPGYEYFFPCLQMTIWGVSSVPFPFWFPFQLHCESVTSVISSKSVQNILIRRVI